MATKLKDRAVLVQLTDHVWSGGMIDRKVSEEVRTQNEASISSVGHYWKRLVPKAATRARTNAGIALRAYHNSNTLPWMENGVRILPVANYAEYMKGIRKLIAVAEAEEKKLIDEMPTWIEEAKRLHGKLFDKNHFPTAAELRMKFGVELNIIPLPNVADWRTELSAEQEKDIRKEAEKKFAAIQASGITELYSRLADVLKHAKERLDDPEAVFRDSLIGNIRDLLPLIARLNVTGDADLENVRADIEKRIAGIDPNTLRFSAKQRKQTASDAGEIMKKMAAYMGTGKAK